MVSPKMYQTIILSGGGAKGPYGLGVLLALEKYHTKFEKNVQKIYCGSSVGALNATIAAQGDLGVLNSLYNTIKTEDILGTKTSKVKAHKLVWAHWRNKPFHYFDNTALRETINKYVKFEKLANSHLLITATNYITGELETFYISSLMEEYVQQDPEHDPERQRLTHYHRIESQEDLVNALLATTAIPFYFPPVTIGDSKYIDGGIGNNTPFKQAAYFQRFLGRDESVKFEHVIAVINDPTRFRIDNNEQCDMFGVIRRTLDIFNNELMSESHSSWERINADLKVEEERDDLVNSQISTFVDIEVEVRGELGKKISTATSTLKKKLPQRRFPLLVIRPNEVIHEDILDFDPVKSQRIKRNGFASCLSAFLQNGWIRREHEKDWNNGII
ncbi:patatin-like phospholipase family protein [Methylophilus sp. 5]|uniref:patatin-like phospholipase family protein n=1 Tax=Methylophilus sp. 5 TaxID=1112274 RepID=UPI00048F8A86|nr:patatin-like phospholipase family protein [Methylophilus sp. 5]